MKTHNTEATVSNDFKSTQTATNTQADEQGGSSLTSMLRLSPATPPTTFIDAIQMPVNLSGPRASRSPNGEWKKYPLPETLKDAFQIVNVSLNDQGKFTTEKKVFTSNGSAAFRYQYGLLTPSVSKSLKNQLTPSELTQLLCTPFTGSIAHLQINCYLSSWLNLISHLEEKTTQDQNLFIANRFPVTVKPQTFSRFEVAREYPIFGDEEELHVKLQKVLGREYGPYEMNNQWKGPRQPNGDKLTYTLSVPASLVPLALKNHAVKLKFYRKGDRLRAEVAFLNFQVSGFPKNPGTSVLKEKAADLIREAASQLLAEAEVILDNLHLHLCGRLNELDVDLLWKKLNGDLKFKSVHKDMAFMRMVEDLNTKGSYTPSQHKQLGLDGERLRKLRHPIYGIFEQIPHLSQHNNSPRTYRLKTGWEATPPYNGKKSQAAPQIIDVKISDQLKAHLAKEGIDLDVLAESGVLLKPVKSR